MGSLSLDVYLKFVVLRAQFRPSCPPPWPTVTSVGAAIPATTRIRPVSYSYAAEHIGVTETEQKDKEISRYLQPLC